MTSDASRPDLASVPHPIERGVEMDALARFYPDVSWRGAIEANAMGPGTPRMIATGRGTHRAIQDGRWLAGDYEQDQFLEDGTFVLRWQLHWVVGWDPEHARYSATLADNYGRADVMWGAIGGDVLEFETRDGAEPRLRLTWDASRPPDLTWKNEISVAGGPWALVEEYVMEPLAAGPR